MIAAIAYVLAKALTALLLAAGVAVLLGAVAMVSGLCRASAQDDGEVAVDLEIDQ